MSSGHSTACSNMADSKEIPSFTFHHIPDKTFLSIEEKDNQDYLMKWGMKDNIKIQMFSFDQPFQPYQCKNLIHNFMTDSTVVNNLEICSPNGWNKLGQMSTTFDIEIVPCSILSLDFFDRLKENDIVLESGDLHKCFDDYYEDFIISDELRKMLLLEDSENHSLYSTAEKEQFLYCLLKHFCLGGKICQYEDEFEPYLNMVKKLYKDLICVQKDPETKQLRIISSIYKITTYSSNFGDPFQSKMLLFKNVEHDII